jgi:hypothetical protein
LVLFDGDVGAGRPFSTSSRDRFLCGRDRPSAFAWPPLLSRFVEILRDVVH